MRKAATFYVASAALGCLALALSTLNCGGSSGEGPAGTGGASTGGTTGSGGTGGGSGGSGAGGTTTPRSGLDCANAVVPGSQSDGTLGVVTDFSEWNNSQGRWGTTDALYGAIYSYAGASSSMNSAKVEGTPPGMHLTGAVADNDYGGGGIGFSVCAKVEQFTQIQFDIIGGAPGCDLELQLQTFAQRPTSQSPAGGCNQDTTSCYNFPVIKQVIDVSLPIAEMTTVTKPLSEFSDWSTDNANQVVGLQWQFTGTTVDMATTPDGCPIDVTITNVKFLP
jgi:hypothetical protein